MDFNATDLLEQHKTKSAAARAAKVSRQAFRDKYDTEQAHAAKRVEFGKLPSVTPDVTEIIERRCKDFERNKARTEAERWLPITVNETQPFGLMVFGDEHADDNHCDWPTLRRDLAIARETPGTYACALGDITNNWVGRLVREYADQSVTRTEARELARWLLTPEAAPWIFRNIGNHDFWNEGDVLIGLFGGDAYYIAEWESRIELRAGGLRYKIHAGHNFKGTSIYNPTHGPLRASLFSGGNANLYLAGHLHEFGTQAIEIAETRKLVHVARARGYKRGGRYEKMGGWPSGQVGSSLFIMIDPLADTEAGMTTIFNDPLQGARVLNALRKESAPKSRGSKDGKAKDDRTVRPGRGGKKHGRKAAKRAPRSPAVAVRAPAKKNAKRARRSKR